MKKIFVLSVIVAFVVSCGGNSSSENTTGETPKSMVEQPTTYDPKRGEGKFDESNVKIGALDAAMATKGESISGTKCTSCHKLTDEKLVGPGWKGVTTRRTPHWIMNFITNPDPMINKDPEVQAQLEICLVRMPNQSLVDEDARNIVEFMRKNDGVK
ncbi:MAG: c-type cytochrome [Ferruginibacter sp.]|nr:cytochrome c [Ferruginibacter sp.]